MILALVTTLQNFAYINLTTISGFEISLLYIVSTCEERSVESALILISFL